VFFWYTAWLADLEPCLGWLFVRLPWYWAGILDDVGPKPIMFDYKKGLFLLYNPTPELLGSTVVSSSSFRI
jgi:hypothetical protein